MRSMRALLAVIGIIFLCLPYGVHAAGELSVTPVVIDEKAKARDIIKQSITIRNTTDRKLDVYPSVNDVLPEEGAMSFVSAQDSSDRSASLANWIELSRGVIELGPGEEKTIPFVIRVNLNALPGSYHAAITFSHGAIRDATSPQDGAATVMVNVEVQADIKEVLQLNKFITDNIFFSGDDVLFNYQLQNIGNQELKPKGEIRIYNRKGEEVAAIDVNVEGKAVKPDDLAQLASVWTAAQGFGKFKAFLNVEYGSQMASVQDTVFFWVIPWQQVLALTVGSLIALIVFALYFHRWFEERHLMKLAHAGMLKVEGALHIPHAPEPASVPPSALADPVAAGPKRSFFSRFSFRRGSGAVAEAADPRMHAVIYDVPEKKEPVPRAAAIPASAQTPQPETARPSIRERLPIHAPAHGDTIDLKRMQTHRVHKAPEQSHGHIINLKKSK